MAGLLVMGRHVPLGRRVAARDVAAAEAQPQVNPVVQTGGVALRAARLLGRQRGRLDGLLEVLTGQSSLRSSRDSSRSRSRWARVSTSSGMRPSLRATLKTRRSAPII